MGEIRKRGRTYQIRYYRNGERIEESTGSKSFEKARDVLRDREGDLAKGIDPTPKAKKFTYDDAAKDLETDYSNQEFKSLASLQRRLTKHLTPWFTGKKMAAIIPGDVADYRAARKAEGAAGATINRELAALKRMFSLAIENGRLYQQPHIEITEERNTRKGFLDPPQFAGVKALLPEPVQPLVEFLYLTGWRKSEVFNLEWRNVDWNGRVVRLDPGTTKNGDGRVFPFTIRLEIILKQQLVEHERLKKATPPKVVARVFHRDGKPIKDVYGAWRAACVAAGYPGKLLHDMRRSASRNALRKGVAQSAIMDLMGHRTAEMFKRYSINDENSLRDQVAKLDQDFTVGEPQGQKAGTK
jgi:integrase